MRNQTRFRFYVEFIYDGVENDGDIQRALESTLQQSGYHDVKTVFLESELEVVKHISR